LKLSQVVDLLSRPGSHPAGVRGLKLAVSVLMAVAMGRTPQGCVD